MVIVTVYFIRIMNTLEIDAVLEKIPGFIGAFPFNELPQRPDEDFSVVINTDSDRDPGAHWVALVKKDAHFYFFDSYGREVNDELFTDQFKTAVFGYIKGQYTWNSYWFQQLTSNACGYYCVYFIRSMQSNNFKSVTSIFGENLKKNDEFVTNYVKNL